MDEQTKRMFLATALCILVLLIWMQFTKAPPQQTTTTGPAASQAVAQSGHSGGAATSQGAGLGGDGFAAVGGNEASPITLGSDSPGPDNTYRMQIVVDPRSASIRTVTLTEHRATVKSKKEPTPAAFKLLEPVMSPDGKTEYRSFAVRSIRMLDAKNAEIDLSDVTWRAERFDDDTGEGVRLSAAIRQGEFDVLRLARVIHLSRGDRHFEMRWEVENLSDQPQKIAITDSGPIGVSRADTRFDHTRVMVALIENDGSIRAGENVVRSKVVGEENRTHQFKPGEDHIYWQALCNKYFTCLVFPQPLSKDAAYAAYVDRVSATPRLPGDEDNDDGGRDLTTEQVLAPPAIAPGETTAMAFDVYCGDKSERQFEAMPLAVARHYALTSAPDRSACTFESIGVLMRWLLDKLYLLVRNYGIAIIVLVIIVRLVLHPVTRKGQINMLRMQKNQARIKPKLDALQKQYKNDKQKLGEETMRLYREEGINPASTLSGCLPMLLQTPIWIALYTTLNTDISLRHEPFFGYIRDLSAPDVLIDFGTSFHIPLIWKMMGPISSLNILPIIMAAVMLAQMKLSQKLAKDKKKEEEANKPATETAEPDKAQDMMAQQQKMMTVMMPFFGLLFYNMPSGLCLYILSNSLLGMGELYFIRKHIREDEKAGKLDLKAKPRKKGFFMKKFEELQKQAEAARLAQAQSGARPRQGKKAKKPKF